MGKLTHPYRRGPCTIWPTQRARGYIAWAPRARKSCCSSSATALGNVGVEGQGRGGGGEREKDEVGKTKKTRRDWRLQLDCPCRRRTGRRHGLMYGTAKRSAARGSSTWALSSSGPSDSSVARGPTSPCKRPWGVDLPSASTLICTATPYHSILHGRRTGWWWS